MAKRKPRPPKNPKNRLEIFVPDHKRDVLKKVRKEGRPLSPIIIEALEVRLRMLQNTGTAQFNLLQEAIKLSGKSASEVTRIALYHYVRKLRQTKNTD